jgi:hypothetical protein
MDDAADSTRIAPADRELTRRLTVVAIVLFLFTAAFSTLFRLYSKKFRDVTGRAEWIWPSHQISRQTPIVFFASRDFDLPGWRKYTRIKVLGDPEYTLFFNGKPIGGRRVRDDRYLDIYDVTELARDGRNRILVAVRSSNGVGGLITSVDITPEAENVVATGKDWRVFQRWHDALPLRDAGLAATPMSFGTPPAGRWNYLIPRSMAIEKPPEKAIAPQNVFRFVASRGEVRIVDGVPVAGKRPAPAVVYDFGPVKGRIRLTLTRDEAVAPMIEVKLGNTMEDLAAIDYEPRAFPFAPGERSVTDPDVEEFRYVMVYSGRARAEVVQ